MKDYGLVSILIPGYNREIIVNRAIDSAINQTYKNIEIVIVDNSSTDNTWEVIKKRSIEDDRIKVFRNKTNLGPVGNWKQCIDKSSGIYRKFLWSDDEIAPSFVEKTVEILENNKDVGFVYTSVRVITDDSEFITYNNLKSGKTPCDFFVKSNLFRTHPVPDSPGCAMFRGEDVVHNFRYNIENPYSLDYPRFGAGNDLFFYLYCCNRYNYFWHISDAMSIFYAGKDSLTMSNRLSNYYQYARLVFIKDSEKYYHLYKRYCSYLYVRSESKYLLTNVEFFKNSVVYFGEWIKYKWLQLKISIYKTL